MMNLKAVLSAAVLVLMAAVSGLAQDDETPKAVYNYKTWDCTIKGNSYTLVKRVKLTINSKRGEGYNEVSISENQYQKLKRVEIKVFDASGKELYKRKKKDLSKACGFGSVSLYSDVCTYYTTLEAPRYPYSIEYEYELECKSLFFWRGPRLQHFIPVEHVRYTLTAPSSFLFSHKVYGLDIKPYTGLDGSNTTYTWEAGNIPKLEKIDYLPPGARDRGRLEFVANSFKLDKYGFDNCTWSNVGRWYGDLAREKYLPKDSSVVDEPADLMEVARSCYEEVVDNIHYVAIQIGVGGWQPYAASLTESRGYGDCKDMSTLLISKLRNRGIEAYPVMVLTRGNGPIDREFPEFGFNHIITMAVINGDTVWMDPTCNNCPFGEVHMGDEDIDVVVVGEDGGRLVHAPPSRPEDNVTTRTTAVHIDSTCNVKFISDVVLTGNDARRVRNRVPHFDKDETRRFVDRQFEGAGKKFKIKSYEIANIEDRNLPVIISVEAEMTRRADKIGKTVYFAPFFLSGMYTREFESLDDREYPLSLFYPFTEVDYVSVTMELAGGLDSVVVPAVDSIAYSFGDFSCVSEYTIDSTNSNVVMDFTLSRRSHVYQIETEEFAEFVTYRNKVDRICDSHVKVYGVK